MNHDQLTENSRKLKLLGDEVTKELRDLVGDSYKNVNSYTTNSGDGKIRAVGAWRNGKVAVAVVWLEKGSDLETHIHRDSFEYFIGIEGKIEFTTEDGTILLEPNGTIFFPPGKPHSCNILEDSYIVAVTIPPDEGYPDARGERRA